MDATVLNNQGQPYAPTGSNPYSVTYQMAATGTDGSSYSITEALGNGARTAADDNGSDWFSENQGSVQVTADSVTGQVDSTVPAPLSGLASIQGSIVVTSQNDENYLQQDVCAVRP